MARRYSLIDRAEEFKKAKDNIDAYNRSNKKPSKRLSGGTRDRTRIRDRRDVFIKPFGVNTTATSKGYVILTADPETPANAKFKENIVAKGRLTLSIADGDAANWEDAPEGFSPAKVTIFIPAAGDPKYVPAKKSKLYYLKYPGESSTCAFGATSDTEEFAGGARALKNDFRNDFKTQKNFRVNVQAEKFPL